MASASVGAPFLFNDLNVAGLGPTITASFELKADPRVDTGAVQVIGQRARVNEHVWTLRALNRAEAWVRVPVWDYSCNSSVATT